MLVSLATFRCGGTSKFEAEVEEIISDLHSGKYDFANVRVAEDQENGALIGLCATHGRAFPREPDAAYVFVIGVNAPYRGQVVDGSKLGDVLLEDALRQIRDQWSGGLPRVWALVDPDNHASHRLFDRHDFLKVDAAPGGYDVRFLAREAPHLF